MVNPRSLALEIVGKRNRAYSRLEKQESFSESFGKLVFNREVMQRMLPKEIFKNILHAVQGLEKIKEEFADTIASAMKEWAISNGATHFSHWFQPLTGATAEKHDSFIEWNSSDQVIERFTGKQLLQGEPDASSFPSGGLRSTYEARGYTGWDPTSLPFLWLGGDGVTLCIPSVFFSWTGDVLDAKIPLLRSNRKLTQAAMRLLSMTGISASYVNVTVGLEQEYFVVDRALKNLRPDLILTGRTVFGAPSPKGQELQDHYFGSVKDRILYYMRDFEQAALHLGIPVKTRHNEVAPAQHEVAPSFENATAGIDHNILLMELMRQIAVKHDLSCLLHEKPFQGLNGSGKHCNWSLATDTGINLLDPTETPGNNLHFLILLTAILHAVHAHSALLRASIGSASNDFRLGGHEAPPAIISVYLGRELESVLENIQHHGAHRETSKRSKLDFGLSSMPDFVRDTTDRNRTSPMAFTGNKFEFRAVGSSANPALAVTVLNAVVAESLNAMLDEIEGSSEKGLLASALPVIQKYLKKSKDIRFSGDGYSDDWFKEAKRRKLPIIQRSIDAFESLKQKSTLKAFEGILNQSELESRYEIMAELYAHHFHIEARVMIDMFQTQILPAAQTYQGTLANSISETADLIGKKAVVEQMGQLKLLSNAINEAIILSRDLDKMDQKIQNLATPVKKAKAYSDQLISHCEKFREVVDLIETLVDDAIWPLPKYRELLFMV